LSIGSDQDANPDLFAPDLKLTEDGMRLPFGKERLWYGMSGKAITGFMCRM